MRLNLNQFTNFSTYFKGITMIVCGASGIAVFVIQLPKVSLYFYLIYMCCGLASNVLGSITIEIYPTRMRGMAVCIALMMGRIGCVFAVNFIGALITTHCELSFIICSSILIIGGILNFFFKKTVSDS